MDIGPIAPIIARTIFSCVVLGSLIWFVYYFNTIKLRTAKISIAFVVMFMAGGMSFFVTFPPEGVLVDTRDKLAELSYSVMDYKDMCHGSDGATFTTGGLCVLVNSDFRFYNGNDIIVLLETKTEIYLFPAWYGIFNPTRGYFKPLGYGRAILFPQHMSIAAQ